MTDTTSPAAEAASEPRPEDTAPDAETQLRNESAELKDRLLRKALEKQGIRRIDPNGQRFDPNLHQAMYEVPDENLPPGTIVQVLQAGFTIGDRILRPAMVAVAKGGPKPDPNRALNDN